MSMKKQYTYMMMGLAKFSTFLIWAATLPLLIVLVCLLVQQELSWTEGIGSLYGTLLHTGTLLQWSIVILVLNLLSLYLFVASTIAIEHGAITKSLEDIHKKT